MKDFIFFIGRFHVLVLHLPIGILLLAVVMEAMARLQRFAVLRPALSMMWLAGAVTSLATVALGYMHASEPGFTGPAVNHHRWAGTLLALAAVLVWAGRIEAPALFARIWPVPLGIILLLLTITGHLGGNLTHGSTYLTEYAPGPFRTMATAGKTAPEDTPRPKVTDVAKADIYLDIVSPALRDRCSGCHNDDKKRGGLSVLHYGALMKGGEKGPVLLPRNPAGSDLYRRVTLPRDNADFMPKNNKAPLDPAQIAALRWWITIGAPPGGAVGSLKPPADVLPDLKKAAGL